MTSHVAVLVDELRQLTQLGDTKVDSATPESGDWIPRPNGGPFGWHGSELTVIVVEVGAELAPVMAEGD